MMVVIAHAESPPNQVADHRAGPQPGLESGSLRPRLDQQHQILMLRRGKSCYSARTFPRTQALGPCGLEPLQPAIDGAAGNVELGAQRDHRDPTDVTKDGLRSAPGLEIFGPLGVVE